MAKIADLILSPQEKKAFEPLLQYLAPEKIADKKEFIVNRPMQAGYETFKGDWEFIDAPDLTYDLLMKITNLLADKMGLVYDVHNPIMSMRLPGGHRAQIVAGQQNLRKFSLTVRLIQEREIKLSDYQMSDADKHAVIEAVQNQKTLLVSGGTGSGKTTFLNSILGYIPSHERLVTLEDVPELKLSHENVCSFMFGAIGTPEEQQRHVNSLLNACLRMRPDRILLGEIRKENAFVFCSAINTGHKGSIATIHANNPDMALDAVINRVLLNGDIGESAINILRRQLIDDIYGVVQLERAPGGVAGYFKILGAQ